MPHIGCKFECLDLGVYIVLDCLHSLGVTDGVVRVFAHRSLRLRRADQKHFCPLQNRIESSRLKCATHPLIIRAARHSSHSDTGSMCIALACPILWSFQIGSRWIIPLSTALPFWMDCLVKDFRRLSNWEFNLQYFSSARFLAASDWCRYLWFDIVDLKCHSFGWPGQVSWVTVIDILQSYMSSHNDFVIRNSANV